MSLLACDWGRLLWTATDTGRCLANAVQRVALHSEHCPVLVQLCKSHKDIVLSETDPHAMPAAQGGAAA